MVWPNECCNPLEIEGHNCVRLGLFLLTTKKNDKFIKYIGKYVCNVCRMKMYRDVRVTESVANIYSGLQ